MGEGIGGHVAKGGTNRKVDLLVNAKDASGAFYKRAAFLAAIKAAPDAQAYLAILRDQAGVTDLESSYLRDRWYEEGPQGFWSWLQPVYPILVRGLIKAIEVAGTNLPLDTYWAPVSDQVEVIVAKSDQQVTRIVLTPPAGPPTMPRPFPTSLWTVRRGSASDSKGRETADGVVEDVDGHGVNTWQVKEFWAPGS